MALNLRFRDDDWERIAQDWSAWWQGEVDRPMVILECIEYLDAYDPHCASVFLGNYPLDLPVDPIPDEFIPRLENTHVLGDSFPRFWPNFEPGIVAGFAGAQVCPVMGYHMVHPRSTATCLHPTRDPGLDQSLVAARA